MTQFDPHVAIQECPIYHSDNIEPPCAHASPHCPTCVCGGTGRIVPFATLRVEKQSVWSHRDCKALGHCDMVLTDGSMVRNTTDCGGRGWVAESDVEKAHSRLMEYFWNGDAKHGGSVTWRFLEDFLVSHRYGLKEGTFSAAEVWVKEQVKEQVKEEA